MVEDIVRYLRVTFSMLKRVPGEDFPVPCNLAYRGFTILDTLSAHIPIGFVLRREWSDVEREVWVDEKNRAIFTYLEGAIELTIDSDDVTFRRRLHCIAVLYAGGVL